jgi:hypothetical protein
VQPTPLFKYLKKYILLFDSHEPVYTMKNIHLHLFTALAIAASVFLSGCFPHNPCDEVLCIHGDCIDGNCVCEAGYEGLDCGTAVNAKFSGDFAMTESCSLGGLASYTVTVTPKSGSPNEVTMTGFWEVPTAIVTAKISNDGTSFTIENQPLDTTMYNIASTTPGSISADGNTIVVNFAIYDGSTYVDTCQGSMIK